VETGDGSFNMAKKVIQVPIEEGLLDSLNSMSRKRRQSRSKLIREACQQYLVQIENEELDRLYREGYERVPEETSPAEAQVSLANQVLSQESW
jgi:metal-responsive CopG/Arc/MetJ family transcriptional regulator